MLHYQRIKAIHYNHPLLFRTPLILFPATLSASQPIKIRLSRVEQADLGDLWTCASQMPREWYQEDRNGLSRLIETMYERRSSIRDLITAFRESTRKPFPNWKDTSQVSVPAMPAESQECRA